MPLTSGARETLRARMRLPHDIWAWRRYAVHMFRNGWLLILCLLTSSLIATGSVCAGEASPVSMISCGGVDTGNLDADHVPGDEDKGAPHAHTACHGHSVSAPLAEASLAPLIVIRAEPRAAPSERLARRTIDPALKPPKA